jgi:hypothetical protein
VNLDLGLTCKQSSVTFDQKNGGYNIDLLELCQPFNKGRFTWWGALLYLLIVASGKQKNS